MRLLYLLLTFGFSLGYISDDVNKKVLILLESLSIRETHSIFFKILKDRGYDLSYKFADDSSLNLMKFGEYAYKHIVIFAPSTREFGGKVDVKSIVKFVDDGGNIFVTGSSDIGEAIRELASECGMEFDEEKTHVIDHFNYDRKDDGNHTLVVVPSENLANLSVITGNSGNKPFLFRGIGLSVDIENPLLLDILHGSPTSYSHDSNKLITNYPNSVGTNTLLIAALQAWNNARAVFVGSLDFFSDEFFSSSTENLHTGEKHELCGNREISLPLVQWWLGERGVLRVSDVSHHRVGEKVAPKEYTILDNLAYSIVIENKNEQEEWVPYVADNVQLELVRIDPFIRSNLPHKDGRYSFEFKLPDVYGVFKLLVDYHRPGYTHLTNVQQISVRPFTHTQYERFLVSAYPYYTSAVSMLFGVVFMSCVFLYFLDPREKIE